MRLFISITVFHWLILQETHICNAVPLVDMAPHVAGQNQQKMAQHHMAQTNSKKEASAGAQPISGGIHHERKLMPIPGHHPDPHTIPPFVSTDFPFTDEDPVNPKTDLTFSPLTDVTLPPPYTTDTDEYDEYEDESYEDERPVPPPPPFINKKRSKI